MTLEDLLSRLLPALERCEMPYMLTGSVASSAHGAPRSTRDLDIVIAPTRDQLVTLMEQFPGDRYYMDQQQALHALANRSQFNVVDFATGWKVDFIIGEDSDYGRTAMERRARIDVSGTSVYVASAEDVLLSKLRWAKRSGSERQLSDAAGILRTQGSRLDRAYVERWVRQLDLAKEWTVAGNLSQ